MKTTQSSKQSHLVFRPLQPADGAALVPLLESSPDNGRFAISARYQIDPYQTIHALHTDVTGVVAEVQDCLVGIGLVRFGSCCVGGETQPYAWLHSLMVHPHYRNNGIALRLAQERIALARERMGEHVLILASVQSNNAASQSVARKWSQQQIGPLQSALMRVRPKPPDPLPGVTVQQAQPEEYDTIATGLNWFYRDCDLYEPQTAESMATWLNETPFDHRLRHYFVAVSKNEEIVAGLAVTRQCRLMTMQVERLPLPISLLNKIVKMVPPDGVLRQLAVTRIWHAPGQLAAAQHLWETVRWQSRQWGSHLTCFYDPRSPVPKILRTPRWLPKANFTVVGAGGRQPIGGERLIYPL